MLKDSDTCGLGFMIAVWGQKGSSNVGKIIIYFSVAFGIYLLLSEDRGLHLISGFSLSIAHDLCLVNIEETLHCNHTAHNFIWKTPVTEKADNSFIYNC